MLYVIGNLSFILVTLSLLVKDILWLRALSILASIFSITYNYYFPVTPMWVTIVWNMIFLIVNLIHISIIIKERTSIKMSHRERDMYDAIFSNLSEFEFVKIVKAGSWKNYKKGEVFIKENEKVDNLEFIYNGRVGIYKNEQKIAELNDGKFVGEMSFLTEKNATATVEVIQDTIMLEWDQNSLRDLLKRNPALYFSMNSILSGQLVRELQEK
jgi:hypothetical protein